jgi:TonB family protein
LASAQEKKIMLDQLIESNSHSVENKRRGGFLLSTFFVICSIFLSGILWSLFAKDLGMNTGNLEMSALVAPLTVTEEQPPVEKLPKKELKAAPNAEVRTKIIQSINESPKETPEKVSNQKLDVPPRNPNKLTVLGPDNISPENAVAYNYRDAVSTNGKSLSELGGTPNGTGTKSADPIPPTAPPPFVKKEEVKKPSNNRVSLGVINGKARSLVTPPYPLPAKAVRAAGVVNVQVMIDEKGNVTSANAVDGHPLLRQAAENAARASKFNPTLLSNEPVKVTGVIVYKFAAQ